MLATLGPRNSQLARLAPRAFINKYGLGQELVMNAIGLHTPASVHHPETAHRNLDQPALTRSPQTERLTDPLAHPA